MSQETITCPKGFQAAGVQSGIKASAKHDLGILYCPTGAKAAAVFTTNQIVAAPVEVCRKHVRSPKIYAVVVNSGNANACTGKTGFQHAVKMCAEVGRCLNVSSYEVLVASTGVIGRPLPMSKVLAGIRTAATNVRASRRSGLDFAHAILTTDTRIKQAVRHIRIAGREVTLAGTAKGAGMLGPNMATTLCFFTTDAVISKPWLNRALKEAVGKSLNKLTVDGHQSTNDTAIVLASGLAGNPAMKSQSPGYRRFLNALTELCEDLTRQLALDAEGATRMFKVVIKGAATQADAAVAARAVADYDLVKCAVHGGDPNWGRIICAVGSTSVKLNLEKLTCKLDGLTVYRRGRPTRFDPQKAAAIVSQQEHCITVTLGAGRYSDFCYGVDLGREYVTINADYHT